MESFKEVYSSQQGTIKALATDQPSSDGTHHHYRIGYAPTFGAPSIDLGMIKFQDGSAQVNGVSDLAVLNVVADHIEGFDKGPFRCYENQQAAAHIREAIRWLKNRPQIAARGQGNAPDPEEERDPLAGVQRSP